MTRTAATPVSPASLEDTAAFFHEQGYAIVKNLIAPGEVAELAQEAQRLLGLSSLMEATNLRCRWQNDVNTGACVFDAFDPIVDLSPLIGRLATDARVFSILQAIYRDTPTLFKDKLIYKPPGAGGYGLHQDYIAWPSFPHSFVSMVLAIDDADAASGCIEVFPGCHQRGCLTPADGNYHEIAPGTIDEKQGLKLRLSAGDAAFFGAFTPHRSGPNRSRRWRRQLYLSYNARSDGGDCRQQHYREFHAWLSAQYAQYGLSEVEFS